MPEFSVGDKVMIDRRIGIIEEVYDGTDPWSCRDLAPDYLVNFGTHKEVIEEFKLRFVSK